MNFDGSSLLYSRTLKNAVIDQIVDNFWSICYMYYNKHVPILKHLPIHHYQVNMLAGSALLIH